MIKVYCDVCQCEIINHNTGVSNKPAFEATFIYEKDDNTPIPIDITMDLSGNGYSSDVCFACVKKVVNNLKRI